MISTGRVTSGSILAAFLLLSCACSSSLALDPFFPRPFASPPSSLSTSYATGLWRAQPNGVTFPAPVGYSPITYLAVDWNLTISDNSCRHAIKIVAQNSSTFYYDMPLLYVNQTCGFTRQQQVTLAGDNAGSNVFQPSGPWGQGAALALSFSKRIEGIWPFSQHYNDSTLQYVDQLTIAFQGSQAFGALSNTIAFSCQGSCTPPVLP